VAFLACTPWASYDGGDHVLFLGQVQQFGHQVGADPLLFHPGLFRSIGSPLGDTPWLGTLDSPESTVGWWMRRPVASRLDPYRS
jgi:hypothetical protein